VAGPVITISKAQSRICFAKCIADSRSRRRER
jgi:hypothetical protein